MIKRWAKEFSVPYVTKQLFTTLDSPILEYGFVIWDLQYALHSDKIESLQKQFLLFCLRHLGNGWDPNIRLPYEKRLELIKLPSLKTRRKMLNAVFLLKLTNNGVINFQFLLEKLYIRVPVRPERYYNYIYIYKVLNN